MTDVKSRFTVKQVSWFMNDRTDNTICRYDPSAMMSDDINTIKASLYELFKDGSRYAKIYKNGISYQITENDMEVLVNFLSKSNIFKILGKYQSLENSPLDI